MTLFSAPDDPWSHRTRIVIAEKAIEIEIVDVAPGKYPEDLLDLNPYHTTPTLIDRDLVLYDYAGNVKWSSNTQGHRGAFLVVQCDGNLVIYDEHGLCGQTCRNGSVSGSFDAQAP